MSLLSVLDTTPATLAGLVHDDDDYLTPPADSLDAFWRALTCHDTLPAKHDASVMLSSAALLSPDPDDHMREEMLSSRSRALSMATLSPASSASSLVAAEPQALDATVLPAVQELDASLPWWGWQGQLATPDHSWSDLAPVYPSSFSTLYHTSAAYDSLPATLPHHGCSPVLKPEALTAAAYVASATIDPRATAYPSALTGMATAPMSRSSSQPGGRHAVSPAGVIRRRHTVSSASALFPHSVSTPGAAIASFVHECKWDKCEASFASLPLLARHLDEAHFVQASEDKWTCYWRGCGSKRPADSPLPSAPSPTGAPTEARRRLRFDRVSKYLAHMRTHTGERPYPCPHPACGLAFTRVDTRRDHIRKIHADNASALLAKVEALPPMPRVV